MTIKGSEASIEAKHGKKKCVNTISASELQKLLLMMGEPLRW